MRVAVAGATGLIGRALVAALASDGHETVRLTRGAPAAGEVRWDPVRGELDAGALAGVGAVVNLAGRSISALRWTGQVKRDIRESRVAGTRLLAETIERLGGDAPRVLVVASAIGYYGDRGDDVLTEASPPGHGFLADLCVAWEAAAVAARAAGARVVHVRTGLVQAARGGALGRQLPLFKLGLGSRFGSGRQWWSWVALDDVVGIYRHALGSDRVEGALNATAPNPVTNAEHAATLARVLGRPTLAPPVPRLAARAALGEMAGPLLFDSARALPRATVDGGYAFRWPELGPALHHLLGKE